MPFVSRSMFEKHMKAHHKDDDLHVRAISNPEEAARIAALKLVMNTNLREKIHQIEIEHENEKQHLETIIEQIIRDHHEKSFAQAHTHPIVMGRHL